jgi:hypothetical protein
LQTFQTPERTQAVAVGKYSLCEGRSNAAKRLDLVRGCDVEINDGGWGGLGLFGLLCFLFATVLSDRVYGLDLPLDRSFGGLVSTAVASDCACDANAAAQREHGTEKEKGFPFPWSGHAEQCSQPWLNTSSFLSTWLRKYAGLGRPT